jgi:hypothetical protein
MFILYRFLVHQLFLGATECHLEYYYLHYFPPNSANATKIIVAIKTHIFPLILLSVGKIQQFLSNLVAPHRAHWSLVHLHFIREVYLN